FQWNESKLVLRWPNASYYSDDEQAEASQKETLRYRFPYKFFYMWTHDVLHPVSLMAYRNLVLQEDKDLKYELDLNLGQDIDDFRGDDGWNKYSERIKNMIPSDKQGEIFWDEMSKLISIVMIQDQQMKNIQELLETGNKAIILYGPPGTGKTYSAKELICSELGISNKELEDFKFTESTPVKEKGAWALVQFHPNYTYEDFIGGISPCLTSGALSYTLKTGIFKRICDEASKTDNSGKKFIIVIDEINRADLSSVFGELMYALEYRNEPISIPNFQDKFVIPSNVYIIGTMNSIDKSLVTFDLALRRRFGFIKIMPQLQVLEEILSDYNINESCLTTFINRCKELNDHISRPNSRLQLGADYQIGHAYYGKIKDFLRKCKETEPEQIITTFELEKLWEYHLEPLLEEFLGNRIEDAEVKRCLEERKNEFTKPLV
ncbi:MAG: AAA family ATPase, partial [Prevotellaceae bacterium]|nr:AAA family ATPase [Candidatus Colivivens equi]